MGWSRWGQHGAAGQGAWAGEGQDLDCGMTAVQERQGVAQSGGALEAVASTGKQTSRHHHHAPAPADASEEAQHMGVADQLATVVPHGLDELVQPDGGI